MITDIMRLYCPRIGGHEKGMAAITAGIIFPNLDNLESIKKVIISKHIKLGDKNTIINNNILELLPSAKYNKSYIMKEDYANDLRSWLIEPDH